MGGKTRSLFTLRSTPILFSTSHDHSLDATLRSCTGMCTNKLWHGMISFDYIHVFKMFFSSFLPFPLPPRSPGSRLETCWWRSMAPKWWEAQLTLPQRNSKTPKTVLSEHYHTAKLPYSILPYSILPYSILPYSILLYSTLLYSHTAIQPYCHTAVQPYYHTAIQPYGHTAIQPYSHTAIQPYSHTARLLYCHTARLLYSHTAILPGLQIKTFFSTSRKGQ